MIPGDGGDGGAGGPQLSPGLALASGAQPHSGWAERTGAGPPGRVRSGLS